MEEVHIREIPLDNDLRLNLYDASRRLAGDRWLLRLIVRIIMDLDETWIPQPGDPVSKTALKSVIGPETVFETVKTRHFIDERKKDTVFQSMIDDFVRHSLSYLAHPDFGRRFILKQYQDKQKRGV